MQLWEAQEANGNEPSRYEIYPDLAFPTNEIPVVPTGNLAWSNEQFVAACTDNGIEIFHLDSHLVNNNPQGKHNVFTQFFFTLPKTVICPNSRRT